METSEQLSYFVTTPFIDAYRRGEDPEESIDFAGFCDLMQRQADDWGEQGLGRALVRGERVPEGDADGEYVLAIGRFGETKFAALSRGDEPAEVVAFDWPWDWDVT